MKKVIGWVHKYWLFAILIVLAVVGLIIEVNWVSAFAAFVVFLKANGFQFGTGSLAVAFSFWYRQKNDMKITFRQAQWVGVFSYGLGWFFYEALSEQIANNYMRAIAGAGGVVIALEVVPTLIVALPYFTKAYAAKKLGVNMENKDD